MKILFSSHAFLPSVGGLENVSATLAEQFVTAGHEVKLITRTLNEAGLSLPYPVIRGPRPRILLKLMGWCDVYFHNGVSLRTAWPLLFVHRPWVVAHQTWIPQAGVGGWAGRLKRQILARSTNISISAAIAADLGRPSIVIGNPYNNSVFRDLPDIPKDRDLVFCGRLVDNKGTDVLLKALGILRRKGHYPNLSIIGSGAEELKLRALTRDLELEEQVTFEGKKQGLELAQRLNAHRILVVPSIWCEPFGIVALEGIACGCVVVGSEGGGLKDAVGPCGLTFPNGDSETLAARLEELLGSPQSLATYRANAATHLSAYTSAAVAEKYLDIFSAVIQRDPRLRLSLEDASEAEVVYGFKD